MLNRIGLVLAFWLALVGVAQADPINVTRTDDRVGGTCTLSDCTLREAIAKVDSDDDVVQLSGTLGGPVVVNLTQGTSLKVTRTMTIVGGGADYSGIDGSLNYDSLFRHDRILKVSPGVVVTIRDLSFSNGRDSRDENFGSCSPCDTITANGGGAIFNDGGNLTLERVEFQNNRNSPTGGAIGNSGTLALTDVEFQSNHASYGGALFSRTGTVTADRVTFGENQASNRGGGVFLFAGTLLLTNSTLTLNQGGRGGGIANHGGALTVRNATLTNNYGGGLLTAVGPANTTVQNTILGAGYGTACVPAGQVFQDYTTDAAVNTDAGNNVAQDTTCALTAASNVVGQDPRLAPLNENGGETRTMALLFGSPASNAGNGTACSPIDQIGNPRVGNCDVGAFEAIPLGQPTATTEDATDVTSTAARMTGTVNLAGEAGILYFLWGTTPGELVNRTAGVGIGPQTPATRNEHVGGLPPGTTIHYRAVAENASGGAGSTVVKQFTTLPGPPQVFGIELLSVTDTAVTLSFSIDPQGAATSYKILYGGQETAAVDIGSATGPQVFTRSLTGLAPDTEYTVQVVATSAGGASSPDGATQNVRTARQFTQSAGLPLALSDSGNSGDECPQTATINWGDGTPEEPSNAIMCVDDGHDGFNFTLGAQHTYATPGPFRIHVRYDTGNESEAFAVISARRQTLTVSVAGDGRVTGGGIDCPGTCSVAVDAGTVVPLSASPGAGFSFSGWGGACSGTGACSVTLSADAAVSATFAAVPVVQPQPPVPTPAPTPGPTPTTGQDVVVAPASGTVLIKLKGTDKYVELKAGQKIPLGSEVDVRKGRVTLTSVPSAGAAPETADFYGGIFRITQAGGITTVTLSEPLAACPKRGRSAGAAAKKAKTRKLWGDGKGTFRTAGKYSAATVRGTKWLVQDSCSGTLTKVTEGVVQVRDNVKKKFVLVRKGKSYTAKPKRG